MKSQCFVKCLSCIIVEKNLVKFTFKLTFVNTNVTTESDCILPETKYKARARSTTAVDPSILKSKSRIQPSELRSAFGNADYVADQLLLQVGKILLTLFLKKLLCVKEDFLHMRETRLFFHLSTVFTIRKNLFLYSSYHFKNDIEASAVISSIPRGCESSVY